jgi:hypothetical protein
MAESLRKLLILDKCWLNRFRQVQVESFPRGMICEGHVNCFIEYRGDQVNRDGESHGC